MPAVSEEDLQALQDENQKLRERLEEARAKRSEQESERDREYTATMLKAENARLQAEVNAAEQAADEDSAKAGVSTVQAAADEQLERAKAVLEAPKKEKPEPPQQPDSGAPDNKSNGGN